MDLPQRPQRLVAVPVLTVGRARSTMPAIIEGRPRHSYVHRGLERVTLLGHIRETDELQELIPHRPKLVPVVVAGNLRHDAAAPRARAIGRELDVPNSVVGFFLDEPHPTREHVYVLTSRPAPYTNPLW